VIAMSGMPGARPFVGREKKEGGGICWALWLPKERKASFAFVALRGRKASREKKGNKKNDAQK